MQANLNWSQSTASTVDFLNFKELVKFGKERVSELATTPSHDKDSLTIVPNNESFIQLAECAEERVAHTISFIGPTHVGKSTIVRAMMGLDPFPAAPDGRGPAVSERGCNIPTSSNILHFTFTLSDEVVHCLDIEGEGGSNNVPPNTLESEEFEQAVSDMFTTCTEENKRKYLALRTEGVNTHFPRLAYAVSDVIVLIDTVSFAQDAYKKKIQSFTKRATNGLIGDKPALLIVHNQSGFDEGDLGDIEKHTNDFFMLHDPDHALENYFSKICCVKIPTRHPRIPEDFWSGINVFANSLCSLLSVSERARREKQNLLTSKVWVSLMRDVISEFHSGEFLRLGNMLTKAVTQHIPDELLRNALGFYESINLGPSREDWNVARTCATRMLATFVIEQSQKGTALISKNDPRQKALQEALNTKVTEFLDFVDRDKPCCAVTGKAVCVLTKGQHPNRHYNPAGVQATGFMNRVVTKVKKILGRNDCHWDGGFVEGVDSVSNAVIRQQLNSTVQQLQSNLANPEINRFAIIGARHEIWKEAFPRSLYEKIAGNLIKWRLPETCLYCMQNASETFVPRCHRTRCESCHYIISNIPYHVSIPSILGNNLVSFAACVFCSRCA